MNAKMKFDYQSTNDLHEFLLNSSHWLILRVDETGMHLHIKSEDDIVLIPFFLGTHEDIWDFTKQEVWKLKKKFNKNEN